MTVISPPGVFNAVNNDLDAGVESVSVRRTLDFRSAVTKPSAISSAVTTPEARFVCDAVDCHVYPERVACR
jgi:hypothetical protein